MENIKSNLIENAYLSFLIDKIIKKYLDYEFSSNKNQLKDKSDAHYSKLSYIGDLSYHIKNKLSEICEEFCKENFNIKLVFNLFKIKNYFSYKDPIPNDLKSFLVYKFICASCSYSYVGETYHHFKTRIEEHIKKDKEALHINWRKPNSKTFSFHFFTIASVPLAPFCLCFFCCCCCLCFFFHLLFSLSQIIYQYLLLS